MRAGKRDENEREIITTATHAGARVIQMSETAGFDLLVVHPSGNHIVEVKMPGRKDKLTPAERAQKNNVERAGQVYNIVEDALDMLNVLGML